MSEDDKILKFFKAYFTQPKIKEDIAQKILKQAEHYDSKHRGKEFLQKFFDSLQKSFDSKNPKNFITASKRFLFIINKLLGAEVKREKQGKYNQLISQQIVRYYLFFFVLIFKHSLHELIVELKMCRMKWARLISDHAFIALRQQVKKNINNFNLDKGFSEENMEKLKKIHLKRGLTQKESNYYLGLSVKEQSRDSRQKEKQEKSSDSESEEEADKYESGQKRLKTDYNPQYQPGYPGYQNYGYNVGSYYPTPPVYENQPFQTYADPRPRKPSFNETPYSQNPYHPIPYPQQKSSLDSTPQTTPSIYSISPSRSYPSYIPHGTHPNQSEPIKTQMNYEYKEISEPKRHETNFSTLQKITNMRKELSQNLFKCRQCGLCFQTGENHRKHMNEHFFHSLDKVNEAQLKGKFKKQGKIKLLDIKSWECLQKAGQTEKYQFEVLLSELPDKKEPNVRCYFCNEELEIRFSQKYEDWVLMDAIKINDEEKIDIIHFECYESFKSDQNSPVQREDIDLVI